jgi:hypothetical protein
MIDIEDEPFDPAPHAGRNAVAFGALKQGARPSARALAAALRAAEVRREDAALAAVINEIWETKNASRND